MTTIADRLTGLRRVMAEHNVHAFIVPSADAHQGEYTPARFRCRAFLTGFTGSAGTAVVTADHAGLWTDSRYFLEAESVLADTEFTLHRLNTPGVLDYAEWLAKTLAPDSRVGVDPTVITIGQARRFASLFRERNITLVAVHDPFASFWDDRPGLPHETVWRLGDGYTGEDAASKIGRIRRYMEEHGAASHAIATLDDIAWTLNLRGSDIEFNPVFLAFLTITHDAVWLFTEADRLSDDARTTLDALNVEVRPYERFWADIKTLPGPVLLDPDRTSFNIEQEVHALGIREAVQPSTTMKAEKNEVERDHLRNAMVRDGQAMVRFLAWLDDRVRSGDAMDEGRAAATLQSFRKKDPSYISDSFNAISGYGPNGAIVHYSFDPDKPATFTSRGVYLIDSGAHYLDGTTDITRTVAVGTPTAEEREDFTLVLKGHIALARLCFPTGTAGRDIDAVARQALWMHHRNYGHGTGHGVGFVLNVHEGPHKIAPGNNGVPLIPGMVVSNEPGVYRRGRHGIRIENLVVVQAEGQSDFGTFLSFETVTLCPIDLRLIDGTLLTDEERAWLNEYHALVAERLGPGLDADTATWLENATRPI